MIEYLEDDLAGKVFELKMKLQQTEHDLSHVVIERDRAQEKVDRVYKLLASVTSPRASYYDQSDTHRTIHEARRILKGPK